MWLSATGWISVTRYWEKYWSEEWRNEFEAWLATTTSEVRHKGTQCQLQSTQINTQHLSHPIDPREQVLEIVSHNLGIVGYSAEISTIRWWLHTAQASVRESHGKHDTLTFWRNLAYHEWWKPDDEPTLTKSQLSLQIHHHHHHHQIAVLPASASTRWSSSAQFLSSHQNGLVGSNWKGGCKDGLQTRLVLCSCQPGRHSRR